MRVYEDLTDEQLIAEIKEYRAARKTLAIGGGIATVAGEGRRIEYGRGDGRAISSALRELYLELEYRGLSDGDGPGGAIGVEIG